MLQCSLRVETARGRPGSKDWGPRCLILPDFSRDNLPRINHHEWGEEWLVKIPTLARGLSDKRCRVPMWLESTFWTGRMLWQGLSILGPPKPNESNCSDIYSHMRVKFYNIWFWQILTYIHRSAFQGPTSNFLVHSPLWFERPQFAWAQTVGCLRDCQMTSPQIVNICEYPSAQMEKGKISWFPSRIIWW